MSCFCAATSLDSSCRAYYGYSDLCAIKLTNNEGSNFYDKYKKLTPGFSCIYYVSGTLDLPKNDDVVKCSCCGNSVRFSEGYVVGHSVSYSSRFYGTYGELDNYESQKRINESSAEIEKQLKHLVCKDCMLQVISEAPKNKDDFEKDSNKYVKCPGCDSESFTILSLSNLGEPKEPENPAKPNWEELVIPYMIALLSPLLCIALNDDKYCCKKNHKHKKHKIDQSYVDYEDDIDKIWA